MNEYYKHCPIPKPQDKKVKKKANGFKSKAKRVCYYCHTPGAERHEVYGGSNRQISIDHGFQVDLCQECHREIHEATTKRGKERRDWWRQYYEAEYIAKLTDSGIAHEQAVEMWMSLIGRNYIAEVLPR